MKVLSLFDGISVAQQALKELGVKNLKYFASEIDNYALKITAKNHPGTIQLGDVKKIIGRNGYLFRNTIGNNEVKIDLLIGGSPCQDLSVAKRDREGLSGGRSGLFWEYVRILKEVKPKYFILENVNSMPIEARVAITMELFNIPPVMIDASLVSAQNRKRLFWIGKLVGDTYDQIRVEFPEDKGILLKDIIDHNADRKWISLEGCASVRKTKTGIAWDRSGKGYHSQQDRAYTINGKHPTVPTARTITKVNVLFDDGRVGCLNWNEIERLQSFPDNYTDLGKDNRIEKRGGVIGNAFNLEVIKHILKSII